MDDMGPFGFLSKLAGRPSTVLGLAWLLFLLVVMCFFGMKTLRQICPYALAGINEKTRSPASREGETADQSGKQSNRDSPLVTWVVPLISWTILASFLILHFVVR